MIYHLEVEAKFCKVDALINGFPGFSFKGFKPNIFSKFINAYLIGRKNNIAFTITPPDNMGSPQEYSIRGSVKKYLSNYQMTGPDQGEIIASFSQENQPVAIVTFDNEIFNYSSLLKENKKVEKENNVLEYAYKLKTLFMQKNMELILKEFDPKLRDFAIAYSVEKEILIRQFSEYLQNKYYPNNPILNFSHEEIFIRPWCDKRIWEIGVGPVYKEFLLTEPNNEGIEYATRVFAALVNDTLKVVR